MKKLTIQEEEAMQLIWNNDGGFIRDFLQSKTGAQPIPYTTLASTIRNLERKGYVRSIRVANAFRYESLISREEYKLKFMHHFVNEYFKDSYKEVVSFFAREEKISPEELAEIMQMIKKEKS